MGRPARHSKVALALSLFFQLPDPGGAVVSRKDTWVLSGHWLPEPTPSQPHAVASLARLPASGNANSARWFILLLCSQHIASHSSNCQTRAQKTSPKADCYNLEHAAQPENCNDAMCMGAWAGRTPGGVGNLVPRGDRLLLATLTRLRHCKSPHPMR